MAYVGEKPKQGGAPGNQFMTENDSVVKEDYTLRSGLNAHSVGPIVIEDGVTVTVEDGAVWLVS